MVAMARVKVEPSEELHDVKHEGDHGRSSEHIQPPLTDNSTVQISRKRKKVGAEPSRRPNRCASSKPLIQENKGNLVCILDELVRAHRWHEASGVLSVLLAAVSREKSDCQDEKNYHVAMELIKRFGRRENYQENIKLIYQSWMGKLENNEERKLTKNAIQLELALFYISQENLVEAQNVTKSLIQDRKCAGDPRVNLLHGMILYQLWYTGLPKKMQIKNVDIHEPSQMHGMEVDDAWHESEMLESSNCHVAVNLERRTSSLCNSESSVGNDKEALMDCKNTQAKRSSNAFLEDKPSISESAEANNSPYRESTLTDASVFFAHGLDTSLLPIHLKDLNLNDDLEKSIISYRKLTNEYHRDAVRHLRLALYSTPPTMAALQPLIQLLLLGDHVGDAFEELEKCCERFDVALPFRLRARLLECFRIGQWTSISKCYENALTRDPTCIFSLNCLIRISKAGHYGTVQLLEMIALHLDSTNGQSSSWIELASCFIKLRNEVQAEYEDRFSIYEGGSVRSIPSTKKLPEAFCKEHTRNTWSRRCRWWARRHFSNTSYQSDVQTGEGQLLASKAAAACHLYGPRCKYVIDVLSYLRKERKSELLSLLGSHLQDSTNLYENL